MTAPATDTAAREDQRAETAEAEDFLVVEIYLKSRKFESKIQVPLHASKEQRDQFIDSWFNLMQTGLKTGGAK